MVDTNNSNEQVASVVLGRLIEHLKKNSTLSNMSSIGPKADDYHCFIGRGESITEIVAKIGQVNYHTLEDITKQYMDCDTVLINQIYLEGLIKECTNQKLLDVIARDTGLTIPTPVEKTISLNFKVLEDTPGIRELIATTKFYTFEIYEVASGWKAMVRGTANEKIGARIMKTSDEAKKACTEYYNNAISEFLKSL